MGRHYRGPCRCAELIRRQKPKSPSLNGGEYWLKKARKCQNRWLSQTFLELFATQRNPQKTIWTHDERQQGRTKRIKFQPQPKANQKENEPKLWLIFWIGERWVKVIGERGEPKRWWIITAGERNEPKRWCQYKRTANAARRNDGEYVRHNPRK